MKPDIQKLASPEVQDFLFVNEHTDTDRLVLSGKEIFGVVPSVIAGQLKARSKAAHKLPSYFKTRSIVYPPALNLEQSSSEATGRFKASLIAAWISSRQRFCDLTCGFGIDSFFVSSVFDSGDVVDPNDELLSIARHNHRLLGQQSLTYHHTDAKSFLASSAASFDLIYVDPSRRDASSRKVFRLADCEPDVVELQESLSAHSSLVMVKASPLLDIQQGIRELQFVERVIVVAVDNECKELLFLLRYGTAEEPLIECYNISNTTAEPLYRPFQFKVSGERSAPASFSDPLRYIYEPDGSIMKGGAFKSIGATYNLQKLQVNTHLYTSDRLVNDFPGRAFEVVASVKPDRKLRDLVPDGKANIISRNHPLSVEELKKKTGLSEGGESYVLACSGVSEKFVLIARRLY